MLLYAVKSGVQYVELELFNGSINLKQPFSGKVFNERGHEAMEYFEEELEHYFDNFQDLAESYPIWHRKQNDEEDDIDSALGNFKVTNIIGGGEL